MKTKRSTNEPIGKIEPFGVYDVSKASAVIGVSPRTMQQYIREGKVEAKRFGKEYRIVGDSLLSSLGSATISGMKLDNKTDLNTAGAVPLSELIKKQNEK